MEATTRWTAGAVGLMLALGLAAVAAPAAADFHPDCEPPLAAYANVWLGDESPDDDTLTYRGGVYCPGANVAITSLVLVDVDTGTQVDAAPSETCQAGVSEPCHTAGSVADLAPGTYNVSMTFDVDNPDTDTSFQDVPRHQHFEWLGAGQPVPVCAHAGAIPASAGTTADC